MMGKTGDVLCSRVFLTNGEWGESIPYHSEEPISSRMFRDTLTKAGV